MTLKHFAARLGLSSVIITAAFTNASAFCQEIETNRLSLPPALIKADGLIQEGRYQPAQSIVDEYLAQNPKSIAGMIRKARLETKGGDYAQAERTLNSALKQNPNNIEVLEALGRLYYQQSTALINPRNQLDKAALILERALAINPSNYPSITTLGLVKLEKEDTVSAERAFRQVLTSNPTYVPALQGLARYYIKNRDWTNARYTVNQALEIEPNSQENYYLAAQLLAIADFPADAIQYAIKSESLDYGRNLDRDYLIATQYEKLGELQKAVPYHQRVLAASPKFTATWKHLGDIYDKLNQPEMSQQAFQKAVALDPNWLESMKTEALQALRQGSLEDTQAKLAKAMKIQPSLEQEFQPLLENLAYAMSLSKALNKSTPEQLLPAQQLPISNNLSFGQMKAALGEYGYVAGFVIPSAAISPTETKNSSTSKTSVASSDNISGNGSQALLSFQAEDVTTQSEALFLAGAFSRAKTKFEESGDILSAQQYATSGDRFMLLRDYRNAQVAYQRALDIYRMEGTAKTDAVVASISKALQRIDQQTRQASQLVSNGDQQFSVKLYDEATVQYLKALQINPTNESAYLRLIDALANIKPKADSKALPLNKALRPSLTHWAYYQAIQLNPGLRDSKGFNKAYEQAVKKAQ